MHESADIFSLNVNDDTKSSHELISSQIEDTKWHIETVKGSEHQIEACRRLEYLMLAPKLALFCLLSDWLYLGCRMFMASKAAVVGPAALVVLSIEVCFAAIAGLLHLQSLSAWGKAELQLPVRLRGDRLPTVDVFLPCCGEELQIIMDTVRAACILDYPPESYRVIVLDDGHSKDVREGIERLSRENSHKNLHYASRRGDVTSYSKAGNLNHGLDFVDRLPHGSYDFVAVLDIDMIPLPQWLRAVLPYLMADGKVGLANPPQRFYNIPNHDPLVQNLDIAFDALETLKVCVSSSWCTGTGYIVRRRALDQIRGFPTGNFSGDGIISVHLTSAGWKTAYVPETVQWGLVPDAVKKHRTQRARWMSIFTSRINDLWSEHTKGHTTVRQRVGATILSVVLVAASALIAFSAVAVPWVLFTGSQVVTYQSPRQLRVLLCLESMSFLANFLNGFNRSRSARSRGPIFLDFEQVGVSPFQIATIIQVTISQIVGRQLISFAPSSKTMQSNRPSGIARLSSKVDADLLANICILSAHLAAGYSALRTLVVAAPGENFLRSLFSQFGYPAFILLWVKYVLQSGTKIPVMISSRSIWPLRGSLLIRDPISRVAYPSKEAVNPRRTGVAQTFTKLALFYHCFVLVSTWWIE